MNADLPSGVNPFTMTRRDLTDAQNRLATQVVDGGLGGGPVTTDLAFDLAGNLTCDGVYFYQYDAWNRLVQVNRAVYVGTPGAGSGWQPDSAKMLKHHVYDGLGRLVNTQSPYPNVDYPNHGIRSEHFYYDGIRRIQELVVEPVRSRTVESERHPEVEMRRASAGPCGPGQMGFAV